MLDKFLVTAMKHKFLFIIGFLNLMVTINPNEADKTMNIISVILIFGWLFFLTVKPPQN